MGGIERFVAAALRQRLFVLLCLAALVATGVAAYRDLPTEAFPDLTNNQVVVVTDAPGLAAIEVEQRVSYPIETAVMGVPGAEQVRSISKQGLSIVSIVFADAVPVYFARQLVGERLLEARGRIPDGLEPTLGPVATAFGEIYQYLVEGDTADAMAKKTLHDWEVRTRLRSVPGVSEINTWGGLTQQYHVLADPRQLDRFGLTLHQLLQAIADNNASFGGGFIEHRSERYTVRGVGLARSAEDIGQIVVASVEGTPIYVRDVAEVRVGAMARQGAVSRDGKGESVAGMVIMLKGENGKSVAERVKARMAEIAVVAAGGPVDQAVLRPDRGDRPDRAHRPQEPRRRLAAGGRRALRVPRRRPRRPDGGRRHPALDAGGLHRDALLRGLGEPDVARRDRLRPDRGRRGRDDGELRQAACRVPARPGRGSRDGPPPALHLGGDRGRAPDPVRRPDHHRRLPAGVHPRGARGEDVPADGDHGLLGPSRLAAAVAHGRAGRRLVPAEAGGGTSTRAAGSSGCAASTCTTWRCRCSGGGAR